MVLFLAMIFLQPPFLYGHGASGEVSSGGIVVAARYDTGEPMSYAKVKISAPGAEVIFQSGRTDRNGRFCFFPDAAGDWKVVVDDGIGHRLELIVPVDESLLLKSNQQKGRSITSSLPHYERVIVGISIIFGISGILFWWRGKKVSKRAKGA